MVKNLNPQCGGEGFNLHICKLVVLNYRLPRLARSKFLS